VNKKYQWNEIRLDGGDISTSSGVYAWYYTPILSDRDIEKVEDSLLGKSSLEKKEIYQSYLQSHLLNFYKEDPYKATIIGALKPVYKGCLEHSNEASESLVEKLVDSELTLFALKNLLLEMDENFLSPIYIGMASNISTRLSQHKSMIQKESDFTFNQSVYGNETAAYVRDTCFAERIISRKYVTSGMFVVVKEAESHSAVENILNRINYPILGRN